MRPPSRRRPKPTWSTRCARKRSRSSRSSLAVAPAHQRRGIGAALLRAGLQRCRQLGIGAVVVPGHPSYYPRFGFQPSARFGIRSEFDAADEAFMLIELQPECLQGASGIVRYHAVFKAV